ncbi:MAG: hypothetical protein LBN01_03130 [Endomicrobium sp.]|jgi:hypothetical protein|nr:hypothetical protein [Endomicrobium sp.]
MTQETTAERHERLLKEQANLISEQSRLLELQTQNHLSQQMKEEDMAKEMPEAHILSEISRIQDKLNAPIKYIWEMIEKRE